MKTDYKLQKLVQDYLEQEVTDISDLIIAESLLSKVRYEAYNKDKESKVYEILCFLHDLVSQTRYQKGNALVNQFLNPVKEEVVQEATA